MWSIFGYCAKKINSGVKVVKRQYKHWPQSFKMSAIKSTAECNQENALCEMSALMTAFSTDTSTRRQLDEELNNICTKYKHPFGTVTKTRNGAFRGGGYQGGMRMEYYEQVQYQACRFCGASIEKLKL
jgi:hypothetical protein